MKHKILIAVVVAFSSCMKVKKKDSEEVRPQQTPKSSEVVMNQKNERSALQIGYETVGANSRVLFYAPSNWPADMVIQKTENGKEFEIQAHFDAAGIWADNLVSEEKVNYKFFVKVGKALTLVDDIDVLPALDLHVESDFDLQSRYKLDSKTKTVYFKNLQIDLQKHLYIGNFSGKVVVKNLISNSGYIQSFAMDARAQDDQPGRSGGVVTLEILNGVGNLSVVMKGENGGNGSPAKDADPALKGAQGARGTRADFKLVNVQTGMLTVMFYGCSRAPANGIVGFQGRQGYAGNSGQAGGNSGSAFVKNYSANLVVEIYSHVGVLGKGSVGGQGGEGGDGGLGADGAEKDFEMFLRENKMCNEIPGVPGCNFWGAQFTKCESVASEGPRGERGPQGNPGSDGINGITEKSCLYQNEQKVGCTSELATN